MPVKGRSGVSALGAAKAETIGCAANTASATPTAVNARLRAGMDGKDDPFAGTAIAASDVAHVGLHNAIRGRTGR
ncbi:hypothetical protein GCM10010448_57180 [Streptomyces glomeratus]|uniref:Uncharacterized protein n=1 Tax=Streptomyces glomeratus TaxID=284452 RepID=A0ABP6LYE9_9ACTN